jgi:hypothetical protein
MDISEFVHGVIAGILGQVDSDIWKIYPFITRYYNKDEN